MDPEDAAATDGVDTIKDKALTICLPMGFIGRWHKQKWLKNKAEKENLSLGVNDLDALRPNSFSSAVGSTLIAELQIHYTFIGRARGLQIPPERGNTLADELRNSCALQLTPILCLHAADKNNWLKVLQGLRESCSEEILGKMILNVQGAHPYELQELLVRARQILSEVWPAPAPMSQHVRILAEITEDMCSDELVWRCRESADGYCLLLSRLSPTATQAFMQQMPAASQAAAAVAGPWICTEKGDLHHMSAVAVEAAGDGGAPRKRRWELLTPYTKAIPPVPYNSAAAAASPSPANPLSGGRAKPLPADSGATVQKINSSRGRNIVARHSNVE